MQSLMCQDWLLISVSLNRLHIRYQKIKKTFIYNKVTVIRIFVKLIVMSQYEYDIT